MVHKQNHKILYRAENFPTFQNRMYDTYEEAIACPRGDIRLVEDQNSGLIYNEAFNPSSMTYDPNYQNEQALSPRFQVHLERVSEIVRTQMGEIKLVEIGCGKGHFLEKMIEEGFEIEGFDPAYEGTSQFIQKTSFDQASEVGDVQGVLLRHVLEHIADPYQFLDSIKQSMAGKGLIYIEVPCFDWIIEHNAWFDIFYEHVNYFRLCDFDRMFTTVVASGKLFGGQYIYAIADLSSLRAPIFNHNKRLPCSFDFFSTLKRNWVSSNSSNAVWGGASKGVIFTLLQSRSGVEIDMVIDINPAKQKKYLPGTGIRVCSPEDGMEKLRRGSTIYVMNSNYLNEIIEMSGNKYQYICVDDNG